MRCPDPGEEAVELAGASRTGAAAPTTDAVDPKVIDAVSIATLGVAAPPALAKV